MEEMSSPSEPANQPVKRSQGVSSERERRWGVIGEISGSLVGGGAALIGVFIDGMPWYIRTPFPTHGVCGQWIQKSGPEERVAVFFRQQSQKCKKA